MAEMTVWRPFADFGELRHRADQLFREMGLGGEGSSAPSVDVIHKDGTVVLRADLPGIKPDEVKITVEDDVLTVSGATTDRWRGPCSVRYRGKSSRRPLVRSWS